MLAQTYSDFEYIIVDGGSKDGTIEILDHYIAEFHGRMSYQSEKDHGIYDAMNKGIIRCKGELIGLLNSDDWYEPDTLENIVKSYTGADYEVVYGMQRTVLDGKEKEIVFYNHEFLTEHMISHPSCFVSKKSYEDLGLYDADHYKSAADYELMLRYYFSGKVTFTPVYKILSNFTPGGISGTSVGVIETAELKYGLGLMSRKKYCITILKARLNKLIGNDWKLH